MSSVMLPPLVRVTTFAALVAPTKVAAKVREAGDTLISVACGFTVRLTDVVFVKLPDTPVMVKVDAPNGAEPLAVRASVLVVVAALGVKTAVTPVGRPEALNSP